MATSGRATDAMAAPRRRSTTPRTPARPIDRERETLRHDLQVHQEELRAQNEKLLATLQVLEETRDRYVELYDAAPTGYCTLDRHGVLREINVCAATLLGRGRESLVGVPLLLFIDPADRKRFLGFLRVCGKGTEEQSAGEEVRLASPRGAHVVQLTCRPRVDDRGQLVELFMSILDVTERRRLEAARDEARLEHIELVQRMFALQEAERRRLAQDIHDDLGQQVTALRLKLEWLAGAAGDAPDLRSRIASVRDAAERVDQHIDFLLRDLRPAGLDELGLTSVLRQSIADWSATFGVAATFRTSGLDAARLPGDAEVQVFRIVQEALNNVHKHAAATEVRVVLERRQGRTRLTVADNGIGLVASSSKAPAATAGGRRGLGLLGMRERATLIGGELEVTSTPGRGTTVTLVVP
jgi:PAS domain S-box-containing protein